MQSLAYQQSTGFSQGGLIIANQRQVKPRDVTHEDIRIAVRSWASECRSREYVAELIVNEWRENGGEGLDIPADPYLQMQKVFRWLDGDTKYAVENIRQLTPAIMAVLPLEYRGRLVPHNDTMSLIADAMKECAEAKQAVLLGAPEHQKLKEVSEGIASLFRLMPEQVGPLMTMVTSMLGVM
ncbi:toxin YdaT domain-containing protein [Yokenella regensburgei]|uniref:toxin YdaT domain-containing protein n=1 Tax=Yokenella regensburgei TaxID=158877 RepID=UPI000593EB88|nr:toxin YdaT domain-containing protein [Yokenella regensburgei]